MIAFADKLAYHSIAAGSCGMSSGHLVRELINGPDMLAKITPNTCTYHTYIAGVPIRERGCSVISHVTN